MKTLEQEWNEQVEQMEREFGRPAREGYKLVRNILSKKVVEIEMDAHFCCDPSTETYHCM